MSVAAPSAAPVCETDATALPEHCCHCFDVLLSSYSGTTVPSPEFPDSFCALFVTWKKAHRDNLQLRGCIGILEPREVRSTLKDYALTSAFRDRRFSPITQDEVAQLHCTVSLIFDFQMGKSYLDWEVGIHGIIINFHDHQGRHRTATFLPEVPAAEGWTKPETIEHLVRKSGYNGQLTQELCGAIQLTTYRSSPCSLSYSEYQSIRQTEASFS